MLEFAHPAMLWALPAAALPILIHLLSRRRRRRVQWAAMDFLLRARRLTRSRTTLQEIIILALRTLAVLLIVMVFARPSLSHPLPGLGKVGRQRMDMIALLDDSPSMTERDGGVEIFSRTKDVLANMAARLAASHSRTSLTVYLASQCDGFTDADRLFYAEEIDAAGAARLKERIRSLNPSAPSLDPEAKLSNLVHWARNLKAGPFTFLILTDMRAFDWATPTAPDKLRESVIEALRALQRQGSVIVVDVAPPSAEYCAITSIQSEPVIYADSPTVCRVNVANRSRTALQAGAIDVRIDSAAIPPTALPALTAESERETPVTLSFGAGYHGVEFRVGYSDVFPEGGRAHLAFESRRSLPVLMVEGEGADSRRGGSGFYLRSALQPTEKPDGGITVETRYPWALQEVALANYAAVALCNIPELKDQQVAALRRYVGEGGGLLIFLGDRVQRDNWNAGMLDPDKGVLPARLKEIVDLSKSAQPARMGKLQFSSPLLSPFKDWEALFAQASFSGFWDVESLSGTEVLASFVHGVESPAILSKRLGAGLTMLVTTSADDKWGDWPRSEAGRVTYLALLHRAVEEMAQGSAARLNLSAGSRLEFKLDPSRYRAEATLHAPPSENGENAAPVRLTASPRNDASGLWFSSEPLDRAGLWRLDLTGTNARVESVSFAVNIQPGERLLDKVPLQAFGDAAKSPDSLRLVRYDDPSLGPPGARGGEHWQLAAALLLGVLVIESTLAYVFGNVGRPAGGA